MASAVILLPFYTLYLTTESFGAFSILLACSLFVQIVVTFSFDTSLYVHFHEYKNTPEKLSAFISSAFLFMVIIGVCTGIIFIAAGDFLLGLFMKGKSLTFYPYGFMAIVTGILLSFFKVYNSLMQTKQQPGLFFNSNLLAFSLIAIGTIAGLMTFPNSLLGPVGARLLSAVVCASWCFYRIIREFGVHFNYKLIRETFNFNFYAFVYQLQQWLMNYFDRILLLFFLPLSDVGVYGFLMGFLVAIEFVLNGLYSSFSPKVVSLIYDQKLKGSTVELNRYYNGLTAVAMLLATGCILFFPPLIETFIKKADYQKVIPYIPYGVLIYVLRPLRVYFGIPFGILKYTKPLPWIYFIVVIAKITLFILLVNHFGLYGAIISSLVSYALEIVLLYSNGKNRFDFTFNTLKLLIAPITLILLVLIAEPLIGITYPLGVHSLYFILCIVMLVLAYRNELRQIDPLKILR